MEKIFYYKTKTLKEDLKKNKELPEVFKESLLKALENDYSLKKEYVKITISMLGISVIDISMDQVPEEYLSFNNINSSILL